MPTKFMRQMLSEKEICIILLEEFKLDCSDVETTQNILSTWGKGIIVCNSDTSLGDDEGCGCPSVVDDDHLNCSSFETNRKGEKLNKWVSYELNENQKNGCFEVSSVILLQNKIEPFLDRIVTWYEKWILYDNRQLYDNDEVLPERKEVARVGGNPAVSHTTYWHRTAPGPAREQLPEMGHNKSVEGGEPR
ncbi:SETMAR [Cordylochernes scorpioides]|uniref:SETMAR n=1 Tax=Cordylochernes scorpioides TaxID=51811 RepID=A0ABY6L7J8_9ARAC|nr:SETMAR [Cordylochernes scorpioides]